MRSLGVRLSAMVLLALVSAGPVVAQDGQTLLRRGEYDRAIELLERDSSPSAQALLTEALIEIGEYERAAETARDLRASDSGAGNALLGRALWLTGQTDAAEEALTAGSNAPSVYRLTALADLAELKLARGESEEASALFDSFIDIYNRSTSLSSRDLVAVGRAVQYLGRQSHVLFQDALKAYDEAIAADPSDPEPQVRVGKLFLEKYNSTEAHTAFRQILQQNPNHPAAHLGVAEALEFDGAGGTIEAAERALETNPNFVPARVFIARQFLALENLERAEEFTRSALEINPVSLDALSVLAAIQYLDGDQAGFAGTRDFVLSLNPQHADLFVTLADLSVRHRKYEDAAAFGERAVSIDPSSWEGYGALGLNQLRTGEIENGIQNLELAFGGDPYNVWFKNTLDLTDTFERYDVIRTPHFELMIDQRESDLLAPYFTEVAERAYAALAERYDLALEPPIRIEAFPSQADFSVRTVGLAGLGALGVSFGPVIAMDSPSADREIGTFNWASTLWHELAHSVHLALSEHEVPRWFTEGLAGWEQRKADPSWGHRVSISFLQMYNEGQILPVSELNNGFVRPSYPQQVVHSYFQALLVCELIETEWGFPAIRGILEGYRDGATTPEVFRNVLGIEIEEFDGRFETFLEERYAQGLAAVGRIRTGPGPRTQADLERALVQQPNDYTIRVTLGRVLYDQGDIDGAVRHFEHARDLFPEYAGPDGPYLYLGRIYRERGEIEQALDAYTALTSNNESAGVGLIEQAQILHELGRREAAAEALERAAFIDPFQIEQHELLATLFTELGRHADSVRERQAVLHLDPVDRAEAHYQLAHAHFRAGDVSDARTQVLRALEIAPTYEAALELLLEIRGRIPEGATP